MTAQTMRTGDDLPLFELEAPEREGFTPLVRKRPRRRNRVLRTPSARRALRYFKPGHDLEVHTGGEFSLLDLTLALLDWTGPASDVVIDTWSVGLYDAEVLAHALEAGRLRSVRFVIDVTVKNNIGSRAYAPELMRVFGAENVRTTRTHSKFVIVTNDDGAAYSVSSTANLNENLRAELFYVSDDPERAAWYLGIVERLFAEVPEGWNPDTGMAALKGLDPAGSPIRRGDARRNRGTIRVGGGA
ncbi:hypothetical protein [Georgenia sp. MJ170]|uniref:hypothetical protein n=1 Tax=Georgenia sunbinii TaxID=3117728 RepID=UPI002F268D65